MEISSASLVLENPLTIKTISEVKDVIAHELAEAASNGEPLTIDVRAGEIDLTFPQLLISARQTADELGVKMKLKQPLNEQFRLVLERAGLLAQANGKDNLWFGEHA